VANDPLTFPALEAGGGEQEIAVPPTNVGMDALAAGSDTWHLTSKPILSVLSRQAGYRDVLHHPTKELSWTSHSC